LDGERRERSRSRGNIPSKCGLALSLEIRRTEPPRSHFHLPCLYHLLPVFSLLVPCPTPRPTPPQGHRSLRPAGARGPQRSQQVAGVGRWAAELAPVGGRSSRPARGRRALAGSLATCGRRSSRPAHGRSSRRADWRRGRREKLMAGWIQGCGDEVENEGMYDMWDPRNPKPYDTWDPLTV
jgi:hypothetical protein